VRRRAIRRRSVIVAARDSRRSVGFSGTDRGWSIGRSSDQRGSWRSVIGRLLGIVPVRNRSLHLLATGRLGGGRMSP